jgi:hypothetical protein
MSCGTRRELCGGSIAQGSGNGTPRVRGVAVVFMGLGLEIGAASLTPNLFSDRAEERDPERYAEKR